jgi:hypothetical protein
MVPGGSLELPTSGTTIQRSNQLSYPGTLLGALRAPLGAWSQVEPPHKAAEIICHNGVVLQILSARILVKTVAKGRARLPPSGETCMQFRISRSFALPCMPLFWSREAYFSGLAEQAPPLQSGSPLGVSRVLGILHEPGGEEDGKRHEHAGPDDGLVAST